MSMRRHHAKVKIHPKSVLILSACLLFIFLGINHTAVRADEAYESKFKGAFGSSGAYGNPQSTAKASGDSIDVGLRFEAESSDERDAGMGSAAQGSASTSAPNFELSEEEIRQQQMRLRQYATSLYADDQLERPPAVEQGNYSVIDTCADTPDQAACQEQESCTMEDGSAGQNYYVEYAYPGGGVGDQRVSRPLCLPAGEVPESGTMPLPVFTVEDLQRLNVAPALSVVEPAPATLINYNTNVYAEAESQQFDTTLAGYPVSVRVHPIEYTWDYGDGTTFGPSPLSGYPLSEDEWDVPTDTSHRYTETGDVSVSLTTAFEGEYSVAGGPWLRVDGTSVVTSEAVPLTVWRAQVRNYADDCLENPGGTGC